jgi:ABC-type polysaccharide/polyol phosphate export permease
MLTAVRELWDYRELGRLLVIKELKLRYRRSVLGFLWTMLNPLLTMIILTVVFSHVMRVQVDRFPVFVLTALLGWNFFSQSVVGGAWSIVHNESLLRNVRVPRAIFPASLVASHLVNLGLALVPLLLVMLVLGVRLQWSVLALPYCLFTIWVFTTGIAFALSAWTVFFRDVVQIVEVGLTGLFYLTPIIYPLSIIPERFRWVFELNPVTYQVLPIRTIFFEGTLPSLPDLAIAGALAVVSFVVGLTLFRRREDSFLHYLS